LIADDRAENCRNKYQCPQKVGKVGQPSPKFGKRRKLSMKLPELRMPSGMGLFMLVAI
jgi:hypothetical protein